MMMHVLHFVCVFRQAHNAAVAHVSIAFSSAIVQIHCGPSDNPSSTPNLLTGVLRSVISQ